MTARFKASDHCLLSILLERSNEETENDQAGITELLAAIDVLTAGWLVPLGVSLLFVDCDPTNYFEEAGKPPQPNQFLRIDSAPPDVRVNPAFVDPMIDTVSEINGVQIGSHPE